MRLLFLAHAGGSASSYVSFKRFLPEGITCTALELAGRGKRIDEEFHKTLEEYAADVLEKYAEEFKDDDYMIFGHSMGGLMAYEINRLLVERGMPLPKHVFISGRAAPDVYVSLGISYTDTADIDLLRFFSDEQAVRLFENNPEVASMMGAILRSDLLTVDCYDTKKSLCPFACDITILTGEDDILMEAKGMEGWKSYTQGKAQIVQFPGGHFYFGTQKEAVCDVIAKKYKEITHASITDENKL